MSDDKYDYVELYVGFYAGVKDKKLNLYDYEGNKITKEDLTIGNYSYSRVDNPAFRVVKGDNNYVVHVYDGSKYVENTYKLSNNSYKDVVVEENPTTPEDKNEEVKNEENTSSEGEESGS